MTREDGDGAKEADRFEKIRDLLTKRLKHYFDLEHFCGHRDFCNPTLVTDQLEDEGSIYLDDSPFRDYRKEDDEKSDDQLCVFEKISNLWSWNRIRSK